MKRLETLNVVGALLSAIATVAAAIAAYFSVAAADRQEVATYASQLASKQTDLLGTFIGHYRADYDETIMLHNEVDDYIRRGKDVPKLHEGLVASLDRKDTFEQAFGTLPLALPPAAAHLAQLAATYMTASLGIDRQRIESWDDPTKTQVDKSKLDTELAPDFGHKLAAANVEVTKLATCASPLLSGRPLEEVAFLKCSQGWAGTPGGPPQRQ